MIPALIALVVVGVLLYLLQVLVPMDARIKQAIVAIVLLLAFLYLLGALTGHNYLPGLR